MKASEVFKELEAQYDSKKIHEIELPKNVEMNLETFINIFLKI